MNNGMKGISAAAAAWSSLPGGAAACARAAAATVQLPPIKAVATSTAWS